MIVGARAPDARRRLAGVVALVRGGTLPFSWPDAWMLRSPSSPIGLVATALISPERRNWAAAGFFLCRSGADRLGAGAAWMDRNGFAALIFVLLIVWVTEIGGYFAGRGIGGPRPGPGSAPKRPGRARSAVLSQSLAVAGAFAAWISGKPGRC